MSNPETTSTGGLESYLGGKCLFHSRSEAWRDLKAWIVAQSPEGDTSTLPAVSESFLAWTISGEVDFQEREYEGPWITHRINKGSFFLTTGAEGSSALESAAAVPFLGYSLIPPHSYILTSWPA